MPLHRNGQCEPAEVDDPVRGRHEERQVVQAVAVDTPDQRADHLADRRERDHAECLCAALERDPGERRREHRAGEEPERELLRVARVVVQREQHREVRGTGGAGEEA